MEQTKSAELFLPLNIVVVGLWGTAEYLRASDSVWLSTTMGIAVWIGIVFMLLLGLIATRVTYNLTPDNVSIKSASSKRFIEKYNAGEHKFYASKSRNAFRLVIFTMTLIMFPLFIMNNHMVSMAFTGLAFAMIYTGIIKLINTYEIVTNKLDRSRS